MKKLYYSLIVLLIVVIVLVMPKVKAVGYDDFDDSAHYIGVIDTYQRDENGVIIGVWVDIIESSLSFSEYPSYWLFGVQYFQPNVLVLQDKLRRPEIRFIWNPFHDKVDDDDYHGSWWLLLGYEYISDDIADAYFYGYEDGYNNGYVAGEQAGYNIGYGEGWNGGFEEGYDFGVEDGYNSGYDEGYGEGYENGVADGREQVLDSVESMEILYQNVILPNGVKDEIINNETLVDRVGVAVFDGSEDWWLLETGSETIAYFYNVVLNAAFGMNNSITNFFAYNSNYFSGIDYECYIVSTTLKFHVRILKNRLPGYQESWTNTEKVNAFKQWLVAQKNAGEPLTVWYQYAEPAEYDLVSLLTNEDGSYKDGYNIGYNEGRVHVQRENKTLLSVIPTTIGSIWLMISDFLSYEVFGLNLWSIIMMFASFSLLILIIKMVI